MITFNNDLILLEIDKYQREKIFAFQDILI